MTPRSTRTIPGGNINLAPDLRSTRKNSFFVDNVSWSVGKHTFKFGGQYTHFIYPQFFLPRSNGDNWYKTTQEFINDLVPGDPGRTLRGAGSGSFLGTQTLFAGYAQDDFKFNPRLTFEGWPRTAGRQC